MNSPNLNRLDERTAAKELAARLMHRGSNAALSELQELPLATQQTRKYHIPLVCTRTNLVVGSLTTIAVAGHMPLIGQWKETQVLHPLFSLGPVALLQFSRNSWLRFCALTAEETADPVVAEKQEQQLQVAALGMLHHLTEVRQDIAWMPAWKDVAANWQSLTAICYWKAYLESDRFKFPMLRISKMERDIDLAGFLKLCWQKKKDYESNLSNIVEADRLEQQRLALAERIMVKQRDEIAGKRPLSIKLLWRWFQANMPTRYQKDMDTWMWELFTATEKDVLDFTVRDIELFEEIFVSECPTGSSISHAFLEVLRSKHRLLTQHFETYEILIPTTIADGVADGSILAGVADEPKLADYPSRVKWFVAHSKWKLAQANSTKHQEAERARQQTETVTPSFRPNVSYLQSVIDEQAELEQEQPDGEDDESHY